jgi:hypothetical protein
MSLRSWPAALCAALLALACAPVQAQTSAGRLAGTVVDPSGASIPNAAVSARNVETGILYKTETGTAGGYMLYPLPPGLYDVTVQAAGFRGERLDGLQLEVGQVARRDIRLEVAPVQQEAVVVSASSVPMLTQSVSVESAILREQIDALPLNGRDFNQLVLLAAGAVENPSNGFGMGNVASNGNRPISNDYLLDGTPNNDVYQGRNGAAVSVDVIREFKVISGVAPAEFGQAGTQVTLVTRSGSNRLHGSAFEYHRGTTWQASNPFNPGAAQPFDRNQFGGSLGGPIRRNRTFFFVNYEGLRQDQSATRVSTVPPDEFWSGNFSSLLARNITLRDPLATGRPVFPGNLLPASRIDRMALNLRPYWGSPNRPGLANNWVLNATGTNIGDQFTVRLDHTLPRNQNLLFRYTRADDGGFAPSLYVGGTATGTGTGQFAGGSTSKNTNTALGWTAPLTARTINETRLGYATFRAYAEYFPGGLPTTESLGMQGFPPVHPLRQPIPRIAFTGNDAFSVVNYGGKLDWGIGMQDNESKIFNLSETITHVHGGHTIKAGIEYRRMKLPALLIGGAAGQINFNSAAGSSSGYTFSDFLLGIPATTQEVAPSPKLLLQARDFSSYIQDDWRVSRRLTLSFGVRHELYANPYEEYNRLSFFDPATGAIVVASDGGKLPTGEFVPAIAAKLSDGKGNWRFPLISDVQANRNPRTLIDPRYRNFGPRTGFVYQPGFSSKFLVRGGYGMFYSRYPFQLLENTTGANPPFAAKFTYSQVIANGVPALTLRVPFSTSAAANVSPGGLQRDFTLPSNQEWNLTIEQDIGWGTVLSLGYVGNKGTHLHRSFNANSTYLDPVTQKVVRRYQNTYGTTAIDVRRTDATSIYNAMQTEFRRRARGGLIFQANWTWAKGLDSVGVIQTQSLDVENLGRDRADSTFVRRHLIKMNGVYDLPFGRGRAWFSQAPRWLNAAIGGWRLSGLWTFNTGVRFTPTYTATGGGLLVSSRPDVVYGVQANLPAGERNASRWFNTTAFAPPPATDPATGLPRLGNAGRNILVGPGISVADASLAKSFPVFREGWRVSFRIELFNSFNHPNYYLPDANVSNRNTAATINSLMKPMRQAQFALRFDF